MIGGLLGILNQGLDKFSQLWGLKVIAFRTLSNPAHTNLDPFFLKIRNAQAWEAACDIF